jgi:hypothetical protein
MKFENAVMPDHDGLVDRLLETVKDVDPEKAADALAFAFGTFVKRSFDVPRVGCDYAHVDFLMKDDVLGSMDVRVVFLRKIPGVDREKSYSEPAEKTDAGG